MDESKINPQTKEKMYYKSEVQFKIGSHCINTSKILEANDAKEANHLMLLWGCHYLGISEDDGNACEDDREIFFDSSNSIEWTTPVEMTVWKWQDEMFSRSLIKRTNFDD